MLFKVVPKEMTFQVKPGSLLTSTENPRISPSDSELPAAVFGSLAVHEMVKGPGPRSSPPLGESESILGAKKLVHVILLINTEVNDVLWSREVPVLKAARIS